MTAIPKCMVVLRTHPDPQIEIDIFNSLHPRRNHLEIARMTMADIVSADTLAKRIGRLNWRGRFSAVAAALAAFSVRKKYDAIYVTGEDIGLPLALMLRTAGWRGRLVVVVHACRGATQAGF